ncbi:MAG: bacteriocin [Clostridia bacterium]|nr:bacteriocin [Clostridia bacterium]
MKLTGKLKKQVDEAANREEKRSLIEQAGMELTDDELDQVSGGEYRGGLLYEMQKQLKPAGSRPSRR